MPLLMIDPAEESLPARREIIVPGGGALAFPVAKVSDGSELER